MSPGQSVVGQAYRRNRLTHQKTPVAATMTYNNKIGAPEIALLRVLSGCPQGATEYHLVTRHNVAPSTIFRLIEAGLLHARTHRMAGFGWSVTRLMISVAGRVAFEKAGSEECGANLMGQADLS